MSEVLMRARCWCATLAFTALGACSGAADANGDDDGDPTGPPPPPPSSSTLVGGWTGTTSQSRPFAMHVGEAGVTLLMIGYSIPVTGCPQGRIRFIPSEPPLAPIPLNSGAFTNSSTGSAGSFTVAGSLTTSGSATGTIVINDISCNGALNATWTATKASGATINLTGTWNATLQSSLVPQTNATFSLVQSGNTLSGTYTVPGTGVAGTVSGTVLGQSAKFTLTQTVPSTCTGTFTGHAVLSPPPEVLFFFHGGTDCLGLHTAGSGTATRSNQ